MTPEEKAKAELAAVLLPLLKKNAEANAEALARFVEEQAKEKEKLRAIVRPLQEKVMEWAASNKRLRAMVSDLQKEVERQNQQNRQRTKPARDAKRSKHQEANPVERRRRRVEKIAERLLLSPEAERPKSLSALVRKVLKKKSDIKVGKKTLSRDLRPMWVRHKTIMTLAMFP